MLPRDHIQTRAGPKQFALRLPVGEPRDTQGRFTERARVRMMTPLTLLLALHDWDGFASNPPWVVLNPGPNAAATTASGDTLGFGKGRESQSSSTSTAISPSARRRLARKG